MLDLVDRTDTQDFAQAVRAGFAQKQKTVPARFLYDERGSELFEGITDVPEYYPTRTEMRLLQRHASDIAALSAGVEAVVEIGSGSSKKTPVVLRAVRPRIYVPVDISAQYLEQAAASIAAAHPGLEVRPLAADFAKEWKLPADLTGRSVLGFFPGSTIGNMTPSSAVDLLRRFARTLGPKAHLLIGIDLRKDRRILEPAYNDEAGITAAFNKNILRRMNRELGGDIPLDAFQHRSVWSETEGRIEMHIVATRDVSFTVAGQTWRMKAGETIHTENSYKYGAQEARLLARAGGWEPVTMWCDDRGLFSLHFWTAKRPRIEP